MPAESDVFPSPPRSRWDGVPLTLLTKDGKQFQSVCGFLASKRVIVSGRQLKQLIKVITCDACKTQPPRLLVRRHAGWVCEAHLSTRIIPDWPTLAERIAAVFDITIRRNDPIREQHRDLRRLVSFLRRRSTWMQRVRATVTDIAPETLS